ncbi:DUF1871 family protein [Neobacillus kokaensis]|uniref:DUF1871 domain-containing protein n=1 Tax=Neobacillus kokaensis TaxID=2759023 RepID=A0ABQ3MYC6_9BACI|nr:DUF1871 family protein [Neobacillus kokaensis]GHH97673.1 hypothetical protein AM1BK_12160 [Neobacillus kokaensis]
MRKEVHTNLKFYDLLTEWNPFQLKNESYETEIADVIQAVHMYDHPLNLAKKIQSVYEFSFEKIIPLESCLEIAVALLKVKNQASCSL